MEDALFNPGVGKFIKTQTYAIALACYGRELEALRGIELWNKFLFLERDVASVPHQQLAEFLMGCIDEPEIASAMLILRNFNDFYIEKVFEACERSDMENNAIQYYAEWLFKSRRQVILNPEHNYHFLQYALKRATK
eukprot:TRINITY_DN3926_c0_g1_i4.p2 TRINITY_DN3926_c0_g1~~TRINITY_DN3926_c0_g1_i4.p2  ORF type:complete len:137 (+),score=32.13 TRINITY_DN3926_c0_g1_i4:719-1129(+)